MGEARRRKLAGEYPDTTKPHLKSGVTLSDGLDGLVPPRLPDKYVAKTRAKLAKARANLSNKSFQHGDPVVLSVLEALRIKRPVRIETASYERALEISSEVIKVGAAEKLIVPCHVNIADRFPDGLIGFRVLPPWAKDGSDVVRVSPVLIVVNHKSIPKAGIDFHDDNGNLCRLL